MKTVALTLVGMFFLVVHAVAGQSEYDSILRERGEFSCLSRNENEIVSLINEFRRSHGLKPIPLSRSLTKVARIHARDLAEFNPAKGTDNRGMPCNMHSWSDHGFWTPVCYTADHYNADLMRVKPQEITKNEYPDVGYENIYWTSSREISPRRVIESWRESKRHRDLILETGAWQHINLHAIGIGVYRNYAIVWFGTTADQLGALPACK